MQITDKPNSSSIQTLHHELQQLSRLSQPKTIQYFYKLSAFLSSINPINLPTLRITLKILLHLQKKTLNFNSKHIPDFWKTLLNLLISSLTFEIRQKKHQQNQQNQQNQPNQQNQSNQPNSSNQPNQSKQNQPNINQPKPNQAKPNQPSQNTFPFFYKALFSYKKPQNSPKCSFSIQDFELLLKLWNKSFSLSDPKSIQYALIALQIFWHLLDQSSIFFSQKIHLYIMQCTQKVCLNLIRFSQKIKDFDTYDYLIVLMTKMQTYFYEKFQKQIQTEIQYFSQTPKLNSGTNSSNIHLNVWEKIVLAKCACLSKKLLDLKSIEEAIQCIRKLKKSLLFQKTINLSKDSKPTYSLICLSISPSQLQHLLFGILLDIWTHLQIIYDSLIQDYTEENENKHNRLTPKELNSQLAQYKQQLLNCFMIMTKKQLNILMVRELVKRLQIIKYRSAVPQWKQIFAIFNLLLKNYPKSLNFIQFTDQKSYITKTFSPSLKFPFSVELKLKGQSIPFKQQKILIQFNDPSNKQKIWITIRNYSQNVIIFTFVKLVKNNFIAKQQKQFPWNQYQSNTIQIVLKTNKIKLSLNANEQTTLVMPNTLPKVQEIILCDRQNGMGSTICQLFTFKIIQYSIFEQNEKSQVDLTTLMDSKTSNKDPIKENLKFHKCKKVHQNSLINFMETLGDLELFMVLLYHTLKKIKSQDQFLKLIRMILNLLQEFTIHKDVQQKELTEEEKDSRRKSILCLSWFFAKQTKSVFIIFQLMRLLYIRGKKCNQEILKFLCNFSYWRDFKLDKQILILMKIKEILKQSSKEQQKIHNLIYCKKLMFDMVLYFKESHYLMAEKQACLKLHKFILETVYDQIKEIIEMPNKKSKTYILDIFSYIEFTINLVSCILNRKISEQAFDITFVIQITLFLRDLSKMLFVSKQRKFITKNDIDIALQIYFKKQEKQLIVPLSLNAQQVLEQRFNLYLTRLMSTSKSLITIFDTETFYFEESQFKIYPISSESPIFCNDSKVHTNIINFNIYMSMLSEKSWNYILFSMPLSEYSERFCQSLWRICFYQLFKEKKYFSRMCKMLQFTPLPQSEYCLIKIFQVLVFYPMFDKEYLHRVLKSQNFKKSICPFKIQQILIKYLNKLEPQICEIEGKSSVSIISAQSSLKKNEANIEEERMYFVLLHSPYTDYDSCKDLLMPLRYRRSFGAYRIIVYNLILKSLVKFSQLKISDKKSVAKEAQSSIQSFHQQKMKPKNLSVIKQSFGEDSENSSIENSILEKCKQLKNIDQNEKVITQQSYDELILLGLQALDFYLKSLNLSNVKKFLKIQSQQDAQAHQMNFSINVECMIKALEICKEQRTCREFEKYLSFIEFYLIKFSLHLIQQKFPSFKADTVENHAYEDNSKKGRTKMLYKTVCIDLIKKSTQFFVDQVKERRAEIHSIEQMWSEVEKKNKFIWNLFISHNKYFSLSEITTESGERLLLSISNDRPKIELPKMINKQSMMCSMSLLSSQKVDAYDESQLSTLFDECELLKTQLEENECKNKERTRKGSNSLHSKEIKSRKFKVLLITNDKIYQGLLFLTQKDIIRFEETYPSQRLYNKIGATIQERRDDDEIEKDPKSFEIILGQEAKIFYRKYLFFDAAIEIYCHEKVAFLCFDSDQKRTKFCSFYLKDKKVFSYEKSKKIIQQESHKWQKGLISNYEYLMTINKHANRTINDLSQYFVMPWTITQFQKKDIDKAYIFEETNFRDLKKPLGKASDKKWNDIKTRYQMSFGSNLSKIQHDMEPFLYGAFYSNPAIVTNYMIRLEPFSSLHYLLQSEKIDVADRLFFQFSDQYRSIMTNTSDIKQLIPEFYSNPQFLKNRSKLNLGSRQNKEIVNDVRLPKWADNAYEFVFKMKFFLESPIVSKHLSHWIDLIFGVHAKKQNALQADNLYMSEIYGPNEVKEKQKPQEKRKSERQRFEEMKNSTIEELENRILFNKQFGIIPLTLFDQKHPELETMEEYYFFKGIVENMVNCGQGSKDVSGQIHMLYNFCMVTSPKSFKLIDTNSTDFTQKQNFKVVSQIDSESEFYCFSFVQNQKLGSPLPYAFYIKKLQRKICSRFIKKTKIFGSIELKDEYEVLDGQCFNWINNEVLIVALQNILKIFSFEECSIRHKGAKLTHLKIQEAKPAVPVREFPFFTQHQAEINFIETIDELKIMVSLDEINRVFILKYSPNEIELINSFTIKNCFFEEKITKILVHKMSLIICLTNYQRLLTFNFYGDLIGAKQIGFALEANKMSEKVNCMKLFNKESSELVFGTNLGNVWKVDIFEFYKSEAQIEVKELWFEKICLNNKDSSYDIKDLKVKRYGRHWQIYVLSVDQNKKKVVNKIKCLTMKQLSNPA